MLVYILFVSLKKHQRNDNKQKSLRTLFNIPPRQVSTPKNELKNKKKKIKKVINFKN